ncbi:hypothetical protein [Alkalinema sp. FACHB-956]|uniref:hypothetical protein n=1 Tax=Alkalinema sp. FACHB-956 TaxID=2692768 RepID=UPI0016846D40|nr:hypothetical protein [Alkalinema sp. FACHB-956]MBD2327286.1 hypothetical protein [Alkalinema sp. FACHB-956]
MGELALLSLLMGSLGLQGLVLGLGLRWQQLKERQDWTEEEQLTPYDSKTTIDPMDENVVTKAQKGSTDPRLVGWEFKIVRAYQDVFRDPKVLQKLCEEEGYAGWILLEKLDDRRVRFKRPIAMREVVKSELLPIDPYRSVYGKPANLKWATVAGIGLILLILPAYLGFVLVSSTLRSSQSQPPIDLPPTSPSTN